MYMWMDIFAHTHTSTHARPLISPLHSLWSEVASFPCEEEWSVGFAIPRNCNFRSCAVNPQLLQHGIRAPVCPRNPLSCFPLSHGWCCSSWLPFFPLSLLLFHCFELSVFPRVLQPHSLFLQYHVFPPVGELIQAHDFEYHLNAKNAQTLSFVPVLPPELQNFLEDIPVWLSHRNSTVNMPKVEFSMFCPQLLLLPFHLSYIYIQKGIQASNLSIILSFIFSFVPIFNLLSCSDRSISSKWFKSIHMSLPTLSPPSPEYNYGSPRLLQQPSYPEWYF